MELVAETISQIKAQGQSVLVFGAGKTGLALGRLFKNLRIGVAIWDEQSRDVFSQSKQNQNCYEELFGSGVTFAFKGEPLELDPNCKLLIPSPGVPLQSVLFTQSGIDFLPKISELELGTQLLVEKLGARQVVVTGSNGKSTVSSLIHFILCQLDFESRLCGNIGTPVVELIPDNILDEPVHNSPLILTVEASSYQLEACKLIKPEVAVMLNLTDNHLERHGSMEQYFQAKKNLVRRLDSSDTLVTNADDSWCHLYRDQVDSVHKVFGAAGNCDAVIDINAQTVKCFGKTGSQTYFQSKGQLLGAHNLYNVAAALLACQALGADLALSIEAAYRFVSLEHRLEQFTLGGDKLIINDSKATTVSASLAACRAISAAGLNRNIVLLLGGVEKQGSDWSPLLEFIRANKKTFSLIVPFGECHRQLEQVFKEAEVETRSFPSLGMACQALYPLLSIANVLLLSPGCASFDEFSDFEDRGRSFKQILAEQVRN